MWQNSIHNPDDALDANPMKPDSMQFGVDGNDESQLEDALDEVYEDLAASSKDPGVFSGDVEDVMLSAAISNMKKKKADFASRQRRVTVSAVQSARMAGATDMSLAVRNPNRPMLGADHARARLTTLHVSTAFRMSPVPWRVHTLLLRARFPGCHV